VTLKRLIPIIMILIGLCACTQGTPATSTPTISSGIEGFVTASFTCPGPVGIGDTRCQDQPYQAMIAILDTNNNQVTQFQTDIMGYIKISLEPGTYLLHPEPGNPLPSVSDQTIVVNDGQFTQISIDYNLGIIDIPATSTPAPSSGIEGYVTAGPTCPGPVRIGATGCQDQPYQAMIAILDTNNNQVTQFQTDIMGYFKISLEPGTYLLHPEPGNPLPRASDQTIVVNDGQFTQISIDYDTGIR
jgi:hypothetical protein